MRPVIDVSITRTDRLCKMFNIKSCAQNTPDRYGLAGVDTILNDKCLLTSLSLEYQMYSRFIGINSD